METWFDRIKRFYETTDKDGNRLWSKERVKDAVVVGVITETQYQEITGEAYAA